MIDEELDQVLEPDPDERYTDLRVGLSLILLREGDITEADVDAVVNAANEDLILGVGVAGAISERGGPAIQEECLTRAPIKVGQAVMTGGGNLRAKHVIHAVGPVSGEGDVEGLLREATRSALQVATDAGLTSMAIPAISTGVFGVDKAVCARAMLGAMVEFLEQHKTPLRKIEFCLWGADTVHVFTDELNRLRKQVEAARHH